MDFAQWKERCPSEKSKLFKYECAGAKLGPKETKGATEEAGLERRRNKQ